MYLHIAACFHGTNREEGSIDGDLGRFAVANGCGKLRPMNGKTSIQQCVYCGAGGTLTRDHVPPKAIFPKPRPLDLITVPACLKCNQANSKDDEYFRLSLNVREELSENPAVQRGQPVVMRSLLDPKSPGKRQSFINSIRLVELMTPSGIYIKDHLAIETNTSRLRNVVRRIVRGLFYHHNNCRLPQNYEVYVCDEENFVKFPEPERVKFDPIVNALKNQNPRVIGQGVFSYHYGVNTSDPHSTYWILTFYERAAYLGLTVPPLSSI